MAVPRGSVALEREPPREGFLSGQLVRIVSLQARGNANVHIHTTRRLQPVHCCRVVHQGAYQTPATRCSGHHHREICKVQRTQLVRPTIAAQAKYLEVPLLSGASTHRSTCRAHGARQTFRRQGKGGTHASEHRGTRYATAAYSSSRYTMKACPPRRTRAAGQRERRRTGLLQGPDDKKTAHQSNLCVPMRVRPFFALTACICLALAASAQERVCAYPAEGDSWQGRIGELSCIFLGVAPQPVGFHGDIGCLNVVSGVLSGYNVTTFVETGTFSGSSLAYVLRTYPHVTHAFSSEIVPSVMEFALNENREVFKLWSNMLGQPGSVLSIENSDSATMMRKIVAQHPAILTKPGLFWVRCSSSLLKQS